ncbi:MAG: SDR family oxidoreductase [Pseudomonadota bacterium]
MKVFCLGAGYSARAAAQRVLAAGGEVTGTSRSEDGCARLRTGGLSAVRFEGGAPDDAMAAALEAATHVLVSIAPEPDPQIGDTFLDDVRALIARRSLKPELVTYLSTVGVYGDHDGAWVDEDTECRPVSARSKARRIAEDAWLEWARAADIRCHVYRLSGIYGPGRSPVSRLKAGKSRRIVKPGQVFNRIHVEDIASAVMAGFAGRGRFAIYNVTDDLPAPPQDVIAFAAEQLGMPVPPAVDFETADLTPMARSFYGENKRVSNARMRDNLGVVLAFPTYREGIGALAAKS